MSIEVAVIRKRIIEVRIPGEEAVIFIETDDNGTFIKAYDSEFNTIDPLKGGKEALEDFPHGTLTVSHSSPYCIKYYDYNLRRIVKICSPGAQC